MVSDNPNVDSEGGVVVARLRGWPAVLVLVLVLGLWGWQRYRVHTTSGEEFEEPLRVYLEAEYMRQALDGVDVSNPSDADARAVGNRVKELRGGITFPSIRARGSGEEIYVRAEVLVQGEAPPDGRPVRYFLFSHGALTGYTLQYETTAWAYRLALF